MPSSDRNSTLRPGRRVAGSERELVDALVEAYAEWREKSAAVQTAYRRWDEAADREKALAFAGYAAALDLEERAAERYATAIADFRWARRTY